MSENTMIESGNSSTATDICVLTDCEKRMLEVLVNPENYGKNVTEKCQIAGICRETYYKTIKKPHFLKVLNDTSIDLIKGHVAEILAATVKYALKDAKCHSDRRILLEMAGLYKNEQNINLNGDKPIQALFGRMPQNELENTIVEFAKKHPELIQDAGKLLTNGNVDLPT